MVETVVVVDSFPIVLWDIADGGVLLRKGLPAQLSAWCQQGGFMEDGERFYHVQTTLRCTEWDRKRGRGWPTALQKQGMTTWGLARAAGMACTQDGRGFQTPTQETAPFWTLTQMVDFHRDVKCQRATEFNVEVQYRQLHLTADIIFKYIILGWFTRNCK